MSERRRQHLHESEDESLIPGLPNDLALRCFLQYLPARCRARCRCLSRAHAHLLAHSLLPETWALLCLCTYFDSEWLDAKGLHWFLMDPIHSCCHALDRIPKPRVMSSGLQTIALPKQGKALLHALYIREKEEGAEEEEDDVDVDEEEQLRAQDWQVLDLVHRKWVLATSSQPSVNIRPLDRYGFAWAVVGDYLYVAGGRGRDVTELYADPVKKAMRVNLHHLKFRDPTSSPPQLLEWEELPDMAEERSLCFGFAWKGCFCVMGGYSFHKWNYDCYHLPSLESGEVYDPKSRTWSFVSHMWPQDVSGLENYSMLPPTNIAFVKDDLYALNDKSREIFRYDMACNTWTFVGEVPPEWSSSYHTCTLLGVSDQLWLLRITSSLSLEVLTCTPHETTLQWKKLAFLLPFVVRENHYVNIASLIGLDMSCLVL